MPLPARAHFLRPADTFDACVTSAFDRHREEIAPFFSYLAQHGASFSPAQFAFFRANYFYRTQTTIAMIERVREAAQRNHDLRTLHLVNQTLDEELGGGDPSAAHSRLLESSHNRHASVVFGLPPLSLHQAHASPLIIDAARTFRGEQARLYDCKSYALVLGASLAQETAALDMLRQFLHSLFTPYAKRYPSVSAFKQVRLYFDCHINGVEQDHAERARGGARSACRTNSDLHDMRRGLTGFLSAQAQLWNAMLAGLRALDVQRLPR